MAKKEIQVTATDRLKKYLDQNKKDHYNFDETINWKVSTGSLLFDLELGGGYTPGAYKVHGASGTGKTHIVGNCILNFLSKVPGSRGLWVKAEGRLDEETQKRIGIKFVYDPKDWVDGTCFVLETNIFECAMDLIGDLIRNNPEDIKYSICIDSIDAMLRREDAIKDSSQSEKIGAAGLLTSVLLKKINLALNKRGHALFFISQYRSTIKTNQYEPGNPNERVGGGGANAVTHYANLVWQVLPRTKSREFWEGDKMIGHKCAIKATKPLHEKMDVIIEFPVKYGRTGGTSVWREREIIDLLFQWDLIEKKGPWLKFSDELISDLAQENLISPDAEINLQGENKLLDWLSENKTISNFLSNKFIAMIYSE